MSLTLNSQIVAETRIQGVTLRSVIGAYELLFGLDVTVLPQHVYARRISIIGAAIQLRGNRTAAQPLGFARPECVFEIRQGPYQNRMTPVLTLPMQCGQLAALERFRDGGDVTFELQVSGVGTDRNGDHSVHDQLLIDIARSDWLQKLRSAGARDVLLLEVPIPLVDRAKEWTSVANDLQRAETYFRDGDYRGCISQCRTALEEAGHQKFGAGDWAGSLLDRLANKRADMTAAEREAALWAAARHYAHLAHHSASDGGVSLYSRADAQLVLTMCASLIARAYC
ncbi:MAG TPA: hypothetical protein VGR52_00315 [Stellaceae bacterium]|nr:hypothetical protein [Stellaceae bacterium]